AALRHQLLACHAQVQAPHTDPDGIFVPLHAAIRAHDLPLAPLDDLLDAFMQDVRKTRDGEGYADRTELLDYCRRSANPVGRLLLHLYRVDDPLSISRSDAICTALQLINFWQDAGVDLARGRRYLPDADCAAHGLSPAQLQAGADTAQSVALLRELTQWARSLMLQGAPLVFDVPGRAGWELRLVVQGGLRIIQRIEALGWRTLSTRPTLRAADLAPMVWAALWMRRAR
ncbi:MAG: squalene synthase HpnC, partial [Betaproteobacteria bacterium]|nr:squalene synthase HpnC [Betaproteobacteria bacterium]